jgi:prephenate dehydrogenase
MTFSSIAILGPGLLGGSLAMAIRRRMPGTELRVWARRTESIEKVRGLGLADEASTDAAAIAKGAGLIVFCMPVGAMAEVAHRIRPVVNADAVITDVGSVKQTVVETLGSIFSGRAQFVGSHPMAGSEQAGIEAAREDLFEGAVTIVTPEPASDNETVAILGEFWEALGCRVAIATPKVHDEAIALISHLPHLTAAALVQAALRENPASLEWRGNGFLDTTRVALGPPEMWAGILSENREAVKKAIHAMIENLAEVTKLLDANETGALEDYLAEAGLARARLKPKTIS